MPQRRDLFRRQEGGRALYVQVRDRDSVLVSGQTGGGRAKKPRKVVISLLAEVTYFQGTATISTHLDVSVVRPNSRTYAIRGA